MDDKHSRLGRMRIYALLTERLCNRPWREVAECLVAGGVDALQLREKSLSDAELVERARILRQITAEAGVVFIVNDRPDMALLSEADGVHLGQGDLLPTDARRLLGDGAVIGFSTHSVDQARRAMALSVDYIGIGPFAATDTKGYAKGLGGEMVRNMCAAVTLPTVAIGGITRLNAGSAIEAGVTAVAACSALCSADDPAQAARELRTICEDAARRSGYDV